MLLTLAKPAKSEFEYKTHEYSPTFYSSSSARFSPKFSGRPASSLPASASYTMSAEHRGLPPPAAMTMSNPSRLQSSMGSSLASMPPAPTQWQGGEESSKNWFLAKSEEEKRKQEEEKTKQEGLKLDQRRVEQEMLRDSLHGGIPPHLIPLIFAGIGGANIASMSAEWVQEFQANQRAQQQQQHAQAQQQALPQSHPSPDSQRRIAPPPPGAYAPIGYGPAPQTPQAGLPPASTVLPGQHLQGQQPHSAFTPPGRGGPPTSAPRSFHGGPPPGQESHLPRLNTTEMHIQPPPTAVPLGQQAQQSQPPQQSQEPSHSSPIYFHHWVPPTSESSKSGREPQPATPSGKYKVSSERPNASDPEYTSSPKKRKLGSQGSSEAPVAPAQPTWVPPTTVHSYTSPSYSTSSTSTPRRGHGRNRSDASVRGTDVPRGAMSRRATLRGQELYAEHGGPSSEHIPQHHQQYPLPSQHGPDSHYQNPYAQQPEQQQAPAPPLQRNDGRGDGPQARAPSPRAVQGETRQSGPQHQMAGPDLRSVPGEPKQEVRGHQN